MNRLLSFPLGSAANAARRAALSLTLFATAAALCGAGPAQAAGKQSAAKARAVAKASSPKTAAKPAGKAGVKAARLVVRAEPRGKQSLAAKRGAEATTRLVAARGRVHGALHAGRASARRVAFAPTRVPQQAFGLNENEPLSLRSSVAYVIDQNSNQALIDKNSRAIVPIASISKLMTAIVVLDAKMPLEDTMIVTDEDRDYEKGTGSRLAVGSRLSRADMLHIALMSSENRAAAALSRYFPGGRPAFIAAMNQKARELGMMDTHFENSTGLSSQNVSSARDLVKLVEAAYQYPLIRQFSTDTAYEVDTGRAHLHYGTTNALTRHADWQIGVQKTGFINEAGECLVMQAVINQRPVVMVLLDSSGKYSRIGDAQRVRQWLTTNAEAQRLMSAAMVPHSGT
ncbi:D-alanyl-D-alanine endopeptidase [Chitinasiproducens palmae]|uniref:Murein-DD-endopeptidase. Serine peptidase. MEROPS family S11 n=1 Tax=Chitinasiproducens palmae TaxID=1770053 RepID=A0A1H2PS24_9BURK|nr:D-alanyl-D-alanine endopeptidase [Chitinasiproducens palmae]SDV49752.1 murein-DD-endopeptidase. Serine peptidase. MEROPS family S11 [Chitinasiproducens palmae]